MTRFAFDFSVDGIKISGDHRQRSVRCNAPPTRYTITMAIGSAVRSVRYESSVGDVSMDVDQAATVTKQQIIAVVQGRRSEDDTEHDNGDEDGYDHDEQPKRTKKTRKEANDDVPFNRALPVAELPDDFDGEALDGATFLALAK